jgi:hypothetical protein
MNAVVVDVDCRVESPNRLMREYHYSRGRRRKTEDKKTTAALAKVSPPPLPLPAEPPIVVTFTRFATQLCDDDNLATSFKIPRDATARWLGLSDGPKDRRVVWRYAQEKRRELAPAARRPHHMWRVWFRIEIATGVGRCGTCGAIGPVSRPLQTRDESDESVSGGVQQ